MVGKCVRPDGSKYIKWIKPGASVSKEEKERGFNWGFIMEFENQEDLHYYSFEDEIHMAAGRTITSFCNEVLVYDIEY